MDYTTKDHIETVFAQHSLRCTPQRRAIYESLAASTSHPTADQLFYEVGGRVKGMSLATVYNTLEAFCNAGLARPLPSTGGSIRYDAIAHNHIHTQCKKTGAIHDVPEELGQLLLNNLPRRILSQIESQLNFKIEQVQIQLVGEYQT